MFSQYVNAETIIEMEAQGGVYRIPCMVNGAKMKFIFDTGASNVCLSLVMAEYLYDNEFIDDDDILGFGQSSVADGRIVDHIKIRLKDIQIGNSHLNNVEAIVVASQNAPLLMGQSALNKLGSYTISNNLLIIHDNGNDNENEYITQLGEKAMDAFQQGFTDKAVEYWGRLYKMNALNEYGIFCYSLALAVEDKWEFVIDVLSAIDDYSYYYNNCFDFYDVLARAYSKQEDFKKAISFYELERKYFSSCDSFSSHENYYKISHLYVLEHKKENAIDYMWKAFCEVAKENGLSTEELLKACRNELPKGKTINRPSEADTYICEYYELLWFNDEISQNEYNYEITRLSKANNKNAKKLLNQQTIY